MFCIFWDYLKSKQKAKQDTEILIAKLQNSNQNCAYAGLGQSGFEQQGPGAPLFRLAKSKYSRFRHKLLGECVYQENEWQVLHFFVICLLVYERNIFRSSLEVLGNLQVYQVWQFSGDDR